LNAKIIKVERSLYFVNIEAFKKSIYEMRNQIEEKIQNLSAQNLIASEKCSKYLLIDLSAVNYVDTTAVSTLIEIIEDFRNENIYVYICQTQGKFKKVFFYGFLVNILKQRVSLNWLIKWINFKNLISICF
jgi:MFS superfamily sulfate permease-like transporter